MHDIYKRYPLINWEFDSWFNEETSSRLSNDRVNLIAAAYPNWLALKPPLKFDWYRTSYDLFARERLLRIMNDWHLTSMRICSATRVEFDYLPGFQDYGAVSFNVKLKSGSINALKSPDKFSFAHYTDPHHELEVPNFFFGQASSPVIKQLYKKGFTLQQLEFKIKSAEHRLEKKLGATTVALRYIINN